MRKMEKAKVRAEAGICFFHFCVRRTTVWRSSISGREICCIRCLL